MSTALRVHMGRVLADLLHGLLLPVDGSKRISG